MDYTEMMSQHPSFKEEKMSYAYTWAQEDTFFTKWIIQNFEYCMSKQTITSPEFCNGIENDLLWLKINTIKYLHFHFCLKDHNKTNLYAKLMFSILDNKGNMKNLYETTDLKLCKPNCTIDSKTCIYKDFCNEENGNLLNDTLTLVCKITFVEVVKKIYQVKVPECCLLKNLGNIFNEQKFCDITLLVGGREFQAHKNILSGRSPVFAAMFNHEFAESKQNSVTITDIDHDVFKEILKFIYSGRAIIIETMADKLLMAADKYGLERLKVICEEVLINKISTDNVCEFLLLADKHSANHLKVQTMDFIKNHFANVKNTDGWKNIKDSYPLLLISMLERYFEKISLV